MITALKARTGTVLRIDGGLFLVVRHEMKRGATNVAVRLKNLMQNGMADRMMDSEEKLEDVVLERAKAEFLYSA
jgi:translation elongation factor P/translation initiation factor 5A